MSDRSEFILEFPDLLTDLDHFTSEGFSLSINNENNLKIKNNR